MSRFFNEKKLFFSLFFFGFFFSKHHECNHASHVFTAHAKQGDMIIFDLRMLHRFVVFFKKGIIYKNKNKHHHRGTRNQSKQRRPIAYLSIARAWFRDSSNVI